MREYQASAPMTIPMKKELFEPRTDTVLAWLGSGGIYINCRGTRIMIDPVLEPNPEDPGKSEAGFEELVPAPIRGKDVPALDAVLYTHADYDHMAPETTKSLMHTGVNFWGTAFTCRRLQEDFGIPAERTTVMPFGEEIALGHVKIHLTPASHAWQKGRPEFDWYYGESDCCGFYMETPDGTIWAPGDSLLLPEHFQEKEPDVMFWDISSDAFHFGTENSLKLANYYGNSQLILYHYGTYYAPHKPAFSADPKWIEGRLENPRRLHSLAPGEPYRLVHQEKEENELLRLLMNRRSVRQYTGEPIPTAMKKQILQAGLFSASSRNRRPWELVVTEDRKVLEALSRCRVGSAKMLEKAGMAVVVLADPEKSDVWTEDCSIVMANMHLMADSLGLGSCWIQGRLRETPEGISTDAYVKELLGAPEGYCLEAILSVGVAESHPAAHTEQDLMMSKVHWEHF